jgi:hypothetical protein
MDRKAKRTAKTKVLMTVECRTMKQPKQQRSRLDQTLTSASWLLQENRSPVIDPDGCVTTVSVWGRVFGAGKTEADIRRLTDNLIKRAMAYADIEHYAFDLMFDGLPVTLDLDRSPVLFSED